MLQVVVWQVVIITRMITILLIIQTITTTTIIIIIISLMLQLQEQSLLQLKLKLILRCVAAMGGILGQNGGLWRCWVNGSNIWCYAFVVRN